MRRIERLVAGDAVADVPGPSDVRLVGDEVVFERGRAFRDGGERLRLVGHALDVAAAKPDYQLHARLFSLG